jgi:hypothetical protein
MQLWEWKSKPIPGEGVCPCKDELLVFHKVDGCSPPYGELSIGLSCSLIGNSRSVQTCAVGLCVASFPATLTALFTCPLCQSQGQPGSYPCALGSSMVGYFLVGAHFVCPSTYFYMVLLVWDLSVLFLPGPSPSSWTMGHCPGSTHTLNPVCLQLCPGAGLPSPLSLRSSLHVTIMQLQSMSNYTHAPPCPV